MHLLVLLFNSSKIRSQPCVINLFFMLVFSLGRLQNFYLYRKVDMLHKELLKEK